MGMYTELVCAFELKDDTPENVIKVLGAMCNGDTDLLDENDIPNHELFETQRWRFMLRSDSYYFDGDTNSTLRKDDIAGWIATIRCNLKNYKNEIEKFIDWIEKYILYAGEGEYFIGYSRYEEDKQPKLIYV